MNKILKFSDGLISLIMSGQKTLTWRLFDDKDLKTGDEVTFLKRSSQKLFAFARIVSVTEKTMQELDKNDFDGHETYKSLEEMYQTYSNYYYTNVTPVTPLKVVKFKIERFL